MKSKPDCNPKDRRELDRMALFADCKIGQGDKWYRCGLGDISIRGAKIYANFKPEIGEVLQFQTAHMGTLQATVVRTFQDGFAIGFDPVEAKKRGLNDMLTVALNEHR